MIDEDGWPNLFIVGAARSGTTSLHRHLAGHPEVHMSEPKEPHFFSDAGTDPRGLVLRVTDPVAYRRLFAGANGKTIVGESSTSYAWDPNAPRRIHRKSPDAKIILIARNPIERAFSHYLMGVREGLESGSFSEALARDERRTEKGWGVSRLYVELGMYCDAVIRFRETFGEDRVRVLVFEEMARDTEQTLREVCEFLGIDPGGVSAEGLDTAHNAYGAPRNRAFARLLGSSRWVGIRRRLPSRVRKFFRYRLLLRTGGKPSPDPAARKLLRDKYLPEVRRLEEVLGRSMPWPDFSGG